MDPQEMVQAAVPVVTFFALKVVGALVLWVVARRLIAFAVRLLVRSLKYPFDQTVAGYIGTATSVLLNVVLIVAILGFFGIETTSFAALMAGVGIAIGAAWSGLLANLAAGVFILILRPFKIGDFISAGGTLGTVNEIGLFVTTVTTLDNVRTFVGNGKILGDNIQNFTANPYRRVDLVAQLDNSVAHAEAIRLLKDRLSRIPNVVVPPAPDVEILSFTPLGPVLAVRPLLPQRQLLAGLFRHQPRDRRGRRGRGLPRTAAAHLRPEWGGCAMSPALTVLSAAKAEDQQRARWNGSLVYWYRAGWVGAPRGGAVGTCPVHDKSIFWSCETPGQGAQWSRPTRHRAGETSDGRLDMTTLASSEPSPTRTDWIALARELGDRFAARAAGHDGDDSFVADNYADLKAHRMFSAGVPADLGGGGASHAELCGILRTLGRSCGSTALALSMHTHLVAAAVWRRHHDRAPVELMLRRVAAEELVLVSSGGSDWLAGSGQARKVAGGYRIDARKIFSSGCPSGQLLVTSAVLDDPQAGPTVLHFPVPLDAPGVKILDTWHTLGMRGTGSHDITLDDVFVPEAAIAGRRPQGKWHHLFHVVVMVALPLIYAVYVGVAEAARDLAVRQAMKKRDDANVPYLVGEMENELAAADIALEAMIATTATAQPGPETTKRVTIARTLCGRAAIGTVDRAMEVTGGGSFYRSLGLERLFRDVQGARYHPLQGKVQLRYAGRLALGLDIDG